ncbi:gfo/Idh/MocA family oxidoreductase [bacterium]|nr:gfo/Idh/MocA family oxidoreductase [bacterium]
MNEEKKGISRRNFNKAAAVGASAFASFGILTQANAAEKMKIGVVGCGGRGTGAVMNAIQANSNIELVAMADVVEYKVNGSFNRLTKNENIKKNIQVGDNKFWGLDAYKKVIDRDDLDYVILATPPGYRPEHFEYVVEKGHNCFCEKPVATDATGMRRFMKAAKLSEQKKLHIVAGTQRRHAKNYQETVQLIHDGALGEVVAGRAYWNGTLPHARDRKEGMTDLEYQLYNWYNFCWICGDNIVEQHVHNLDIMNWVIGSHPISVIASGGRAWKSNEEKYGNIWDHFSCDYEYPNGVHVMSFSRHWNNSYNEVSERIFGSNRDFRGGISNGHDMGSGGGLNAYVQEHKDLQDSIAGNGKYWNEAMQVAESVFTAIMGRMAAYTGKKYTWEEALNEDLDLVPDKMSWDMNLPVRPIPVPGK